MRFGLVISVFVTGACGGYLSAQDFRATITGQVSDAFTNYGLKTSSLSLCFVSDRITVCVALTAWSHCAPLISSLAEPYLGIAYQKITDPGQLALRIGKTYRHVNASLLEIQVAE